MNVVKKLQQHLCIKKHPAKTDYSEPWDSYYCKKCDIWLEDRCKDTECMFCSNRPKKPSGANE